MTQAVDSIWSRRPGSNRRPSDYKTNPARATCAKQLILDPPNSGDAHIGAANRKQPGEDAGKDRSAGEIRTWDTRVQLKRYDQRGCLDPLYHDLRRFLFERGWTLTADPQVAHFPVLNPSHCVGTKGELRLAANTSGSTTQVEIWQEQYNITNPHGGRYEFGKRSLMPYMLGKRCDLELLKTIEFLQHATGFGVKDDNFRRKGEAALDFVLRQIHTSGHYRADLEHADYGSSTNRRSFDGRLLEHGQTAWWRDERGRLLRGTAYYNLNSMWWFVYGGDQYTNLPCFDLIATQPADVRSKANAKRRERVLNAKIQHCVTAKDYLGAHKFQQILQNG